MTDTENRRIEIAASCRDADYIPKVALRRTCLWLREEILIAADRAKNRS